MTTERTETTAETTPRASRTALKCPICGSAAVQVHDGENPYKQGALHCDACGACTIDGMPR